jgi:hypothetical protein
MFSFIKYPKRYLLQFLLDVFIIGFMAISAAFIALNHQKWDDEYWLWLAFSFLSYVATRCVTLVIWLIKSIAIRHIRLIIITVTNLTLLVGLSWAASYLVLLGIVGLTQDGMEHSY